MKCFDNRDYWVAFQVEFSACVVSLIVFAYITMQDENMFRNLNRAIICLSIRLRILFNYAKIYL